MVECTCTYYRWLQWGVNHAEQCMITSSNGNTFHVLATCAGNSPVPSEFPAQRPVTRSFVVFFVLHLNEWLSKQSWAWWFETPSHPLWRNCYGMNSCQWNRATTEPRKMTVRLLLYVPSLSIVAIAKRYTHRSLNKMATILQTTFNLDASSRT